MDGVRAALCGRDSDTVVEGIHPRLVVVKMHVCQAFRCSSIIGSTETVVRGKEVG